MLFFLRCSLNKRVIQRCHSDQNDIKHCNTECITETTTYINICKSKRMDRFAIFTSLACQADNEMYSCKVIAAFKWPLHHSWNYFPSYYLSAYLIVTKSYKHCHISSKFIEWKWYLMHPYALSKSSLENVLYVDTLFSYHLYQFLLASCSNKPISLSRKLMMLWVKEISTTSLNWIQFLNQKKRKKKL